MRKMSSINCSAASSDFGIRAAQAEDLPALLELYRDLEEAYGGLTGAQGPPGEVYRRIFDEIMADKNQYLLVVANGDKVAGTVTLVVVPNLGHRGRPWGAVENLVVHKDYRGRGFGRRLLETAVGIVRERGCYKLVLSSHLKRTGARRFYEKLGWRVSHVGFELSL